MHRLIFGHAFAELVALILLLGLAFYFLNKKKASVRKNAKDANIVASGSLTAPTGTNSGGYSSSSTETNNGESSSLTAPTGNCYEVFLSFKGRDTRKGFTDHLYNGLINAGIDAFKDEKELRKGKKIGQDLFAAIKNSKILIPILSVNYGTSSWCLNELVQIMECKNNTGHIVLPIFYKVEPAHVGHQIGSFGDAFHKRKRRLHERRFDPMIFKKWKQALNEVSSLKGWDAEGYEGELVKSIVHQVLFQLKKKFELVMPKNLVGIDIHEKKVMEFVDNNSCATLFVGIYGMGGIGKTTLAKTIYNKLSNQFEHCSFIADIRESCEGKGLVHLQNQLIYDILKEKDQVSNKDEGSQFISSKFKRKKVLILLDDAGDDDQLKALAGDQNWFSLGSVIIITTRNKSILDNAKVDNQYEHEEMDKENSLILFSRHAFRRDSPPSEFENLTHKVVSTTGGLPLSLEVLGSFLCGKEPKLWEGTLKKLSKVPDEKVQEKLKISYKALTHEQKQIFLDIACFFIGADERIATYMWDACDFFPEVGIEVLKCRSLIKVGDNYELKMHDQLRDLGRDIVRKENEREPQYRSRLWDSEEVVKVLKGNKGTEKIEAIYLSSGTVAGLGGIIQADEQFMNLTRLRFLHVTGAHFSGDFKNSIEEVRGLRWLNCPSTFEAENFHVEELVALELSESKISDKWRGWDFIMMAKKLKYLDLSGCGSLEETFFLSVFKNLEVLILRDCWGLVQIDSSIGDMESLVCLDLSGCETLEELPAEVGKLETLEQLLLHDSGIKELPMSFRNLSSLQCLNLEGCGMLQSMPEPPSSLTYLGVTCRSGRLPSLFHLTHLKEMHLFDCEFLESILELPSTLDNPFKLEILKISHCASMKTLDVSQLNYLRTLSAYNCNNIPEVRGLDELKHLESFTIIQCASIKKLDLPTSKGMKKLHVENCENLVEIQGFDKLEFVEELYIPGNASIERLDLSKSKGVKKLHALDCKSLIEIQGLDRLELLKELNICGCDSIERLEFPKSKGLMILEVRNCKSLVEIQNIDRLQLLEKLSVFGCASIKRLALSKSKGMRKLFVNYCENLVEIQGLDRLELLEELNIFGCTSIKRLDLPKSEGMKKLYAQNCENLVEIQGLDRLEFMEELYISGNASIKKLDLSKLKGMKTLYAPNCTSLVEIQGLNRLEFLTKLNISWCASIERLEFPKSKGLMVLQIFNCKSLVEIQNIDRLELLKELNLYECASIKRLDLSKCEGIKKLYANYCENLIEIQGLDKLELLEVLNISSCTSIKRLDLPKSEGMKKLHVKNCENLVEIQGLDRLEFVEELYIPGNASIERLDLSKSKGLKKLHASNCKSLVEIQGLDRLELLRELNISGCALIERLDISKSEGMKKLYAKYCENLVEIQGLDRLESLEMLNISGSTSIKRLDLSKSKSMKELYAKHCGFVEIQGLDRLEFLEELYIFSCTSIERLDLSKSKGMKKLHANHCENLVEIQGLDRLDLLKELYISGCASIERLNLPKSKGMKKLHVCDCRNLVEIQGLDKVKFLKQLYISECASIQRLDLLKIRGHIEFNC